MNPQKATWEHKAKWFGTYILKGLVFAIIYQILVIVSDSLIVKQYDETKIDVFFLPPGWSFAFLIYFGEIYAPFLLINPIYNSTKNNRPLEIRRYLPPSIMLNYLLWSFILRRVLKFSPRFPNAKHVLIFFMIAIIAPLTGALMASLIFYRMGRLNSETWIDFTWHWFLGDFAGIMTLTPFLLVIFPYLTNINGFKLKNYNIIQVLRTYIDVILLSIINLGLISLVVSTYTNSGIDLVFILLIPITFVAYRHGINIAIFFSTISQISIVLLFVESSSAVQDISEIQIFLISIGFLALIIGAMVTEQRETQLNLAKNKELLFQSQKFDLVGRVSGGVAHDLNNILTALNGYTDLLEFVGDNEDEKSEYLAGMKATLETGRQLTRQLLSFTKDKTSHQKPISVDEHIESMKPLFLQLIKKTVDLELDLHAPSKLVYAEISQFEQVILNLIVNANDAIQKNGMILIRTRYIEQSKRELNQVIIEIHDTGLGIPEEYREKIFDPFFTTKEKSSGLGLNITYSTVSAMKGNINYTSEVGKGTTFNISLPEYIGTEEPDMEIDWDLGSFSLMDKKILVVDDNLSIIEVFRSVFEHRKANVFFATNGKDALNTYVEEIEFDIVILDVIMPEKTGIEVAQKILQYKPNQKIILISGFVGETPDTWQDLLDKCEFLMKPFSIQTLLQTMHNVLNNKSKKSISQ